MSNREIKLTGIPRSPIESLGLGVFDGLHLGHQRLASHCSSIMTLHPHPKSIILGRKLNYISTIRELRQLVGSLIVLHFTKTVASLSPESFLNDVIRDRLSPKQIVVGYDYGFGHKREGNLAFLQDWGRKNAIDIKVIPVVEQDDQIVKSGLIRQLIDAGEFDSVLPLLNHPYLIIGSVIPGAGRGRQLGFPTANLKVPSHKLLPGDGVYRGFVRMDGRDFRCLMSIGSQPTFGGEHRQLEVFIPGFSGDLYGRRLSVYLDGFVRHQIRFETKEALISQIQADLSHV